MAKQDTLEKPKKYFFDHNNFDEDHESEPEIPPPPVFSEQELADAKKQSFEAGRAQGLAEAKASRDKLVADLIAKITQNFSSLFAAEDSRMGLYESETLYLTRAIFSKLFPGLNEKHGLDEVGRVIAGVLESHRSRPEIIIEVAPDYVESVRNDVNQALKELHGAGLCTITGNPALGPGDCKMSWNDGGAGRLAEQLAEQIVSILDQALADKPRLRDNSTGSATAEGEQT